MNKPQKILLAVLTLSSFLVVLDFTSVFIPLPTIMEELDGALDEGTWVIAAFTLTFAFTLPACVAMSGRWGTRRLFFSGIAVFMLASTACALAQSMAFLIGARAVLGIGAAMVEFAVYTLTKISVPHEKRDWAFKVQSAAFLVGALLGTPLSGVITTLFSWEFIFWLNVGVGAIVVALALPLIPKPPNLTEPGGSIERIQSHAGWLSGGCGVFLLVFALIEGARFGWNSILIPGSVLAAIALLAVAWTRIARTPRALFRNRLYATGNLLRGASEFASMGVYFAVSHVLQVQLGYSAAISGVLLLAVIAGGLMMAPVVEILSKQIDNRWLIIPGYVLTAAGIIWLARVSPDVGWMFFLAPLAMAGAGFTAQEEPTVRNRDKAVPEAQTGAAWRMSYITFLLGIGLGVSVVSALWQSRFAANMKEILVTVGLPPEVEAGLPDLWNNGISGDPAAEIGGSDVVRHLVSTAFTDAIQTALLGCAAVSLLGAAVAIFFFRDLVKK